MIVKDESPVIRRCLKSVMPLIDYWVIVDTGSSDGTQGIISDYMKDVPGELHQRPWVNFGHNRNEALALAKGKGDYLLFIDADEELVFAPGFNMPVLENDFYYIVTEYAGIRYKRTQIINSKLNWRWAGVVHEAVDCPEARTSGTLEGIINRVNTDGNRAKDPDRYLKDARLLEEALLEDPSSTRNMFYLAQSYRDAGNREEAIAFYLKRVAMGGWDQEVFWSLLQVAVLQEELGVGEKMVIENYRRARDFRPSRAEPSYRLARLLRRAEDYEAAYEAALLGLKAAAGSDILFVEEWIYSYGMLFEFSLCAYSMGKYAEALKASQELLNINTLPEKIRESVIRNIELINQKGVC